jgi:predicted O-methyltransferase YrrM
MVGYPLAAIQSTNTRMISDRTGLREAYPASWRWLRIARHIAGWLTDTEGNALFELARRSTPERNAVVVELGSWQGKSSVLLAAGLSGKTNPRLFCIDPFGVDENPRYQNEFYEPVISKMGLKLEEVFLRNVRRCGFKHFVEPIKGYSFEVVEGWQEPIDILFIDASHDYESVHRDLLLWAPFVKVGGMVALHDVSANWPGPSRVMAEDLQPPYFGGWGQADSLLWAIKKSDEPLPIHPEVDVTTIPKSDFDARQSEIARLTSDRKYLLEKTYSLEALLEELRCRAERAEAALAELNDRAQRAEVAEATAREEIHCLSRVITERTAVERILSERLRSSQELIRILEQESQRIATLLAEAEHANRSLQRSWSWRITAPLRFIVDLAAFLRRCRLGAPGRGALLGIAQWLIFRRMVSESRIFDEHFYLERYRDVARSRQSPLYHFFVFGSTEGRRPHFLFDTTYYLKQNADVAASWMNPLVHYLKWGGYEGRKPHPDFDSAFYLLQNPDVRDLHVNPLSHYLGPGTPEGRNPNPWFDTSTYLNDNPQVAVSATNPLIHYLSKRSHES